MSKSTEEKRVAMMKFVEGQNVIKLNNLLGRDIPYEEYDRKILNKREYYKLKRQESYRHKRDPKYFPIKLTERLCKIPADFRLSNLPVLTEKSSLQDYHFQYSSEQLKNMYKTPKRIVDKFYSSFSSSMGLMQRTSFYMVAPYAEKDIPSIYRLSVAHSASDPDHYTISMHAIVGGREDGWLFLGRFDNASVEPHKIVASEYSPKELKKHNAAKIECFTLIDRRMREKAMVRKNDVLPELYCIPFPHMHKPDIHYEVGEDIERCLPKFMRNCVYNTYEENVEYMMKVFNIYDCPHYRTKDKFLRDIILEEKRLLPIFDSCESQKIVDDLFSRKTIDNETIKNKIYANPRNKSKKHGSKVGKKDIYISRKESKARHRDNF